jgi:hypothetical protein
MDITGWRGGEEICVRDSSGPGGRVNISAWASSGPVVGGSKGDRRTKQRWAPTDYCDVQNHYCFCFAKYIQ